MTIGRHLMRSTLVTLSMFIMFTATISFVNANVAIYPEPNIVTSQGIVNHRSASVYVDSVNITIDLMEDMVKGRGTYILMNPDEQEYELELFFDPSYYPKECLIEVNGEEVATDSEFLDRDYYSKHMYAGRTVWDPEPWKYEVVTFNVTIGPLDSSKVDIFWICEPKIVIDLVYSDEPHFYELYNEREQSEIEWGNSYLVISNRSWNRPISCFSIRYISHSEKFNDPRISMMGFETDKHRYSMIGEYHVGDTILRNKVDDGYIGKVELSIVKNPAKNSVTTISMKNWSEYDTMISYGGVEETEIPKKLNQKFLFCNGCLFVLISGIIATFVIRKILKRSKKK